jgi:hypothetical protein
VALYSDIALDKPKLTHDDVIWCIEFGLLDILRLEAQLLTSRARLAFELFAMVEVIYEPLGEATVNLVCLQQNFLASHLARTVLRSRKSATGSVESLLKDAPQALYFDYRQLDRPLALSVVVYLESGCDVAEINLRTVIAVSAGDALYVRNV